MENRKRRGPAKLPPEKARHHHIGIYLSGSELAELANRAGTRIPEKSPGMQSGGDTAARKKIAAYVRNAAFGALPPRIPEANMQIWRDLAPALANLNQIAKQLNTGKPDDLTEMILIDVGDLQCKIANLRTKLFEAAT